MIRLSPISRRRLIARFRELGFEGPFSGGRHQFMSRGECDVHIPNPHEGDISVDLLSRMLRQAEISREEWEGI